MLQRPGRGGGLSRYVRDGVVFWLCLVMLVASAALWSAPALAGGCGPFNITVPHSGSFTIDASTCGVDGGIPFGIISDNEPGHPSPSPAPTHGTVLIDWAGSEVTYRHDGDGATEDSFAFIDAVNEPISVHVTILPATSNINILPATMPVPVVGTAYSQALTASGEPGPYTWLLASGSLPLGLTLNNGVISGTPTEYGPYNFSVRATASNTVTGDKAYGFTIPDPVHVVLPSNPPAGAVGQAYSQQFTVTGGTAPYSFEVEDLLDGLPAGLSLSASGLLSGTPAVGTIGTHQFSVLTDDATTISNSGGNFKDRHTLSITINAAPTITFSPTTMPNGNVAGGYYVPVTASGGTAPYTLAKTAGTLPPGLALVNGVLVGVPTGGGLFDFTITATDANGVTGSKVYSTTIAAPAITVGPTVLPNPKVGEAYSQAISAIGGTADHTFDSVGGMPPGLTLASNGTLSGTPTAAGDYSFTVTATDNSTGTGPYTGSQSYSVTVAGPTISISPTSLPDATAGAVYGQSFSASGGTAGYSFSTSGTLPMGVTVSSSGILVGTPSAVGTFTFDVIATDSTTGTGSPFSGTLSSTLIVKPPTIELAPASLPAATVGAAHSQMLTASGGSGSYTYQVTAGTLPEGLDLASDGRLSGTPTEGGLFNFIVTASDSGITGSGAPYVGSLAYGMLSNAPSIVATGASVVATVGIAYTQTFSASGGTAPYDFAATGTLPAGLSLSPSGVLSGTPTEGGSFSVDVVATDSSTGTGPYQSAAVAIPVTVDAPSIVVDPSTLTGVQVGVPYNATVTASGGTAPYSFSSGTLPAGLSLTGNVISGTPTAAGASNFTITATDSSAGTGPFTGSTTYSPTIQAPALSLDPSMLPAGTAGFAYQSASFVGSGGTGPYSYELVAGAFPPGVTLSTDGVLSGTPTANGLYNVVVTVEDSSTGTGAPFTTLQSYAVNIAAPTIVVDQGLIPNGASGTAYSQTITASGGSSPYTFDVTNGALPAGLTLSTGGVLSGTPSEGGGFNFTVTATDNYGFEGSQALTLGVDAPAITLTPASLPDATVTSAYSQSLAASGGIAPYAFALNAGGLPPGLTLSPSGVLDGIPTTSGPFNFTVTATDSSTGTGPYAGGQTYSMVVGEAVPIAGNVTAAVAYGSADTAIVPSLSGGPATAIAIAIAPAHGTAAISGMSLLYTPAAGYFGADSFTYTATGPGGTSSAAAVTITVATPATPVAAGTSAVVAFDTATAIDLSGSITGVHSSIAVATDAAHGTTSIAGDIVTYTPAPGYFGADSFTYTATGPGGTSAPAAVTLAVATPMAPVAAGMLVAIGHDAATSIDLSGSIAGVHTEIAISTAPTHGTTSIAGDVVTYTPAAGYFGADSFAYTATGPGGTSAPAIVELAVAAPAAPVVAGLAVSVGHNTAKAIDLSASITGAHTAIAVSTAPAHGTTSIAGDVVTYIPVTGYSGSDSFAYTATGPGGVSAPATVTLTVAASAAPRVASVSVKVPFGTPKAIDLSGAITGVHSSIAVASAPAHGTTSIAGDVVTYTPGAGYSGADSFTYTAAGPGGTSLPANVRLTIAADTIKFTPATNTALDPAMAGEGYTQQITAKGGTGAVTYAVTAGALPPGVVLNKSTGELTGPVDADADAIEYGFTITATDGGGAGGLAVYTLKVLPRAVTAVDKTVVVPPGATPLPVDLTKGATGGPFVSAVVGTVTPPEAGTAEVIMGDVAAIDTVYPTTFYLKFHPNPEFSGNAVIGYTLVGASGTSNSATVTFAIEMDEAAVAARFDSLVHGFVETRQSLLAGAVQVPGLLERRGMSSGSGPGTINVAPNDNSITLNFASSLAQMQAWSESGDAAGALASEPSPFNVWIDGTATLHLKTDNGEDHWGKFGLVSVGADYLVNDKLLIGLALHADVMDDSTDTSKTSGTGVLIGPYVSTEIGNGVFLDADIFYGRSWNEVSTALFEGTFETERLMVNAKLEGEWALGDGLTFRPNATAFYLHESVDDYSISNESGEVVDLSGFTTEQVRLSAGGTLEFAMPYGEGMTLAPYVGADLGVSSTNGSDFTDGAFGILSGGFTLTGDGDWTLGSGLELSLDAAGLKTVSAKANLNVSF